MSSQFMFATGIENSYPVITGANGHDLRRDEMESCGHYSRWREDFDLVRELGIRYLRYGAPYYQAHKAAQKFDWSFADLTFPALRRMQIEPIADLCHFGVPDWVGGFQNSDWPELFAEYAAAFAARFPWLRLFTPVNEIRTCANSSALHGWWNERLKSEGAMVNAVRNMARATILAEEAILRVTPDARFIQSEATTFFHPVTPALEGEADRRNEIRFFALDLCYGHEIRTPVLQYMFDNGLSQDDYEWFQRHGRALNQHCVMGNDYYITSEHLLESDGATKPSGEIFGYYVVTREYYDRYKLPVMHTETNNLCGPDASHWLRKEWMNARRLMRDGVPLIGFTWYSLTDQIDWDSALREDNGHVNPVGLFDLDRRIRPVGSDFRRLIAEWEPALTQVSSRT